MDWMRVENCLPINSSKTMTCIPNEKQNNNNNNNNRKTNNNREREKRIVKSFCAANNRLMNIHIKLGSRHILQHQQQQLQNIFGNRTKQWEKSIFREQFESKNLTWSVNQ
jgi:hypothetical protein